MPLPLHSFDHPLIIHPTMVHSVVGTLAPCFATVIDEKLREAATNLHLVIPADKMEQISHDLFLWAAILHDFLIVLLLAKLRHPMKRI
jgi:hypothetical protein